MSQSPFSEAINQLQPKEKEPRSAHVLDGWIAQPRVKAPLGAVTINHPKATTDSKQVDTFRGWRFCGKTSARTDRVVGCPRRYA